MEICRDYSSQYPAIRIIEHTHNQGISSARNTGIRESRGRYCWFIDADDYILPGALEKVLNCILSEEADTYFWGHDRLYEADGALNSHPLQPECIDRNAQSDFQAANLLCRIARNHFGFEIWSKIFSLDLIRRHGLQFPTGFYYGEDLVFLIDYIHYSHKICVRRECIYTYVLHENSMMAKSRNVCRLPEMVSNAAYIYRCIAPNPYHYIPAGLILSLGALQSWNNDLYNHIRENPDSLFLHEITSKLIRSPVLLLRLCGRRSAAVTYLNALLIKSALHSRKKSYLFIRKITNRIL